MHAFGFFTDEPSQWPFASVKKFLKFNDTDIIVGEKKLYSKYFN